MNQSEACNEAQKIAKQAINDYQDEWGIEGPDIGTYVVDCVVVGLLPLIEADVRERIATEIEALGNERVERLSIERVDALSHAARIARGGDQ